MGLQRRFDSSTTSSKSGERLEQQRTTPSHHRRPNYGGFYNSILEQPRSNVVSARPIVVLDEATPTTQAPAGAAHASAGPASPTADGNAAAGGAATSAGPTAGAAAAEVSKGGIVFYSRLAGYPVETPVSVALNYAGVIVPPRPEQPLNCCQSGCIHCVWDLYREDVEEYQLQRTAARKALRAEGRVIPPELGGPTKSPARTEGTGANDGGEEEAPERSMIEDLSPQLQAFIQLEKDLKAKRLSAS